LLNVYAPGNEVPVGLKIIIIIIIIIIGTTTTTTT